MVKISIITATYNSGKTVRDTLESVLRQDYTNYELIIKDGGSKDDTLKICESFVPKFKELETWNMKHGTGSGPSFRIISCADKGIYDAMNQGIAAATGDVVGLLNSDDFYTSDDILSTINRTFEEHPDIDALYGDIHYVKEDDTSQSVRYYSSKMFRRWWMRFGFMPAHPSFYCRKSTYEKFQVSKEEHRLHGSNGYFDKNNTNKVQGLEFKVEGNRGSQSSSAKNTACAEKQKLETWNMKHETARYFDTSYRIAADFDNLLRMIFIGRIKTHYVERDFVTMRMGGASSSGVASHKQINKDHMRSFKENGVYSNYFFISLRYCYKVVEVLMGKI